MMGFGVMLLWVEEHAESLIKQVGTFFHKSGLNAEIPSAA